MSNDGEDSLEEGEIPSPKPPSPLADYYDELSDDDLNVNPSKKRRTRHRKRARMRTPLSTLRSRNASRSRTPSPQTSRRSKHSRSPSPLPARRSKPMKPLPARKKTPLRPLSCWHKRGKTPLRSLVPRTARRNSPVKKVARIEGRRSSVSPPPRSRAERSADFDSLRSKYLLRLQQKRRQNRYSVDTCQVIEATDILDVEMTVVAPDCEQPQRAQPTNVSSSENKPINVESSAGIQPITGAGSRNEPIAVESGSENKSITIESNGSQPITVESDSGSEPISIKAGSGHLPITGVEAPFITIESSPEKLSQESVYTIPDSEEEFELEQLRASALKSQRTPTKVSGDDEAPSPEIENEFLLRAEALKTAIIKKRMAILRKRQSINRKKERSKVENRKNNKVNGNVDSKKNADEDPGEGKENQEGEGEEALLRQQLLGTLQSPSPLPAPPAMPVPPSLPSQLLQLVMDGSSVNEADKIKDLCVSAATITAATKKTGNSDSAKAVTHTDPIDSGVSRFVKPDDIFKTSPVQRTIPNQPVSQNQPGLVVPGMSGNLIPTIPIPIAPSIKNPALAMLPSSLPKSFLASKSVPKPQQPSKGKLKVEAVRNRSSQVSKVIAGTHSAATAKKPDLWKPVGPVAVDSKNSEVSVQPVEDLSAATTINQHPTLRKPAEVKTSSAVPNRGSTPTLDILSSATVISQQIVVQATVPEVIMPKTRPAGSAAPKMNQVVRKPVGSAAAATSTNQQVVVPSSASLVVPVPPKVSAATSMKQQVVVRQPVVAVPNMRASSASLGVSVPPKGPSVSAATSLKQQVVVRQPVVAAPDMRASSASLVVSVANKGPSAVMERIVVRLGLDSSDDEDDEPKATASMASGVKTALVSSIDDFLLDARRRLEATTPSTPEAVHAHLPPSQRLEYMRLKKKLAEKELSRKLKSDRPGSPLLTSNLPHRSASTRSTSPVVPPVTAGASSATVAENLPSLGLVKHNSRPCSPLSMPAKKQAVGLAETAGKTHATSAIMPEKPPVVNLCKQNSRPGSPLSHPAKKQATTTEPQPAKSESAILPLTSPVPDKAARSPAPAETSAGLEQRLAPPKNLKPAKTKQLKTLLALLKKEQAMEKGWRDELSRLEVQMSWVAQKRTTHATRAGLLRAKIKRLLGTTKGSPAKPQAGTSQAAAIGNAAKAANQLAPSQAVAIGNAAKSANQLAPSQAVAIGNAAKSANHLAPSQAAAIGNAAKSAKSANQLAPSQAAAEDNEANSANRPAPSRTGAIGNTTKSANQLAASQAMTKASQVAEDKTAKSQTGPSSLAPGPDAARDSGCGDTETNHGPAAGASAKCGNVSGDRSGSQVSGGVTVTRMRFVDYESPLDGMDRLTGALDPLKELCPHDLAGQCRDPDCAYQHLRHL